MVSAVLASERAFSMPEQIALDWLIWKGGADATAYQDAFTDFVRRHSRFAFRVAYSVLRNTADAEDVGQEAFLKLYRARTWQQANDERAFLARTVWRLAVDRARSVRRPLPETPTAEPTVKDDDLRAMLHRLIESLPDEFRHPIVLSTVDEMTSAEISKVLDIPEGTVRSRLSRAREILKAKANVAMRTKS